MARKVFLSILGNGFYENCNYYWQTRDQYSKQRFVQKACVDLLLNDWNENDQILLFLTNAAYKNNWNQSIHKRVNKDGKEEDYQGLENLLPQAKTQPIPDGKTTEEIWAIFDAIYNSLQENDEVHLDITHSFRYLPMLLLVLLNYAKYLKNITLKRITYGNYEARDNDNFAPIMDLTAFSELQDWSIAANDFINFGQVTKIAELTDKRIAVVLKNKGYIEESAKLLKGIKNELINFATDIQTCRGQNIISNASVIKVHQYLEKLQNEIIKPLNPILDKLKNRIKNFKTNNILNGLTAVEWCIDNGLIQQGITILQETAINYTASKLNVDMQNPDIREAISSGFYILSVKTKEEDWDEKCKKNKDIIEQMLSTKTIAELKKPYERLRTIRNDINHNGMRKDSKNGSEFKKLLEKSLTQFREIIKDAH